MTGHGGLARQLDRSLMRKGANHDEIDGAREIARDILDRLALADPDIAGRKINRMTTELRHAGLEGDARPQRRLLENHRERFSAQVGMLEADFQLGLEPRAASASSPLNSVGESELRSRKSRFSRGGRHLPPISASARFLAALAR